MLYGYINRGGTILINEEESKKLKKFIKLYTEGKSIPQAGEAAGIDRSPAVLRHMLSNPYYLGNKYYPAILSKRMFNKIQKELEERSHAATRTVTAPILVYTRFKMKEQPFSTERKTPAAAAEDIYNSILTI